MPNSVQLIIKRGVLLVRSKENVYIDQFTELQMIDLFRKGLTVKQLTERFGAGKSAIYRKLAKYGVSPGKSPHYTKEEKLFIALNYGNKCTKEIADALNRKPESIRIQACLMGIRKKELARPDKNCW